MKTFSSNRVSQVFNDLCKKDHYLEKKQIPEKVDLKIKNLAENRLILRHFGRMYDHLISNSHTNAILKLFSNLLGRPNPLQISEKKASNSLIQEEKDQEAPIGIKGPN